MKIKYFNPNRVEKNSRKGVIISGKAGYREGDIRLAILETNLIFRNLNTKKA